MLGLVYNELLQDLDMLDFVTGVVVGACDELADQRPLRLVDGVTGSDGEAADLENAVVVDDLVGVGRRLAAVHCGEIIGRSRIGENVT